MAYLFANGIYRRIFLHDMCFISIPIPLEYIPGGHINSKPPLIQTMAWWRSGEKPLSESVLVQ